MLRHLIPVLLFIILPDCAFAQADSNRLKEDTFFLAKQKGVLGRLGRSVSRRPAASTAPIKSVDQFQKYAGKIIRYIEVVPVGFNQDLNDTAELRHTLAVRTADKLHHDSRISTIRKNLFFREGNALLPLLFADNERFLRTLPYLRDAAIVVYKSYSSDSVDVIVLTRDVFSIGGRFSNSGLNRVKAEIREENFLGLGARLAFYGLYDRDRSPKGGYGAEYIERNVKGTFLVGTVGFRTFKNAIINSRFEENTYYLRLEKPLVNRYTEWTGAFAVSLNQTSNAYLEKSVYQNTSEYSYVNFDLWGGYNIGWGRKRETDSEKRLRHFVAARGFYNHFELIPAIYKDSFNYNFTNYNGGLVSYSLYKQNFYITNFIYGFGINEDIPIGINATVTAGWTNIQSRLRGYYGAEFTGSHYTRRGFYNTYTFKAGMYKGARRFEDIGLLFAVDHFTNLKKLSRNWYNRNFVTLSYGKLIDRSLVEPLRLNTNYGLLYFRPDSLNLLEATGRATVKLESVFYNLRRVLGFRLAPFVFGEYSWLDHISLPSGKSMGYPAVGAGARSRNDNLVFGTVQLRFYYFPGNITTNMQRYRIQFNSNIRFRYNSSLVNRPDFIRLN